jgi:hypothetical protein
MDACELERLIKETYNANEEQCDIVSGIMMDQKIIEADAYSQDPDKDADSKEVIKKFIAGELELSEHYPDNAQTMGPQVLEYIINDLCFKKKIKKGEFLIRFDD